MENNNEIIEETMEVVNDIAEVVAPSTIETVTDVVANSKLKNAIPMVAAGAVGGILLYKMARKFVIDPIRRKRDAKFDELVDDIDDYDCEVEPVVETK